MSKRVMLIGDPHFANHKVFGKPTDSPGVNSRCANVTKTLQYWSDRCVDLEVDMIFILGDITHYHGALTPPIANQIECALMDLSDQCPVVVISGNHDMDGNDMSIVPFIRGDATGVRLVEGMSNHKVGDHTMFWACSYAVPVQQALNAIRTRKDASENNILLMHHSFEGAVHGHHEFEPPGGITSSVIPDDIQVFSGHYHKRQKISDNVQYIGAPLQHDFGEATYTPGVTLLDIDEDGYYTESFYSTPRETAPRFEILAWDTPVADIPGDIGSDYYRIDLPADVDPKEVGELKDALTNVVIKPIPLDSQLRSRVEEVLGDLEDEDGNDRPVSLDDTIEAYAHMHIEDEERAGEMADLGRAFVKQMLGEE